MIHLRILSLSMFLALCPANDSLTVLAQAPLTVQAVKPLAPTALATGDSLFFSMEPLASFRRLEARVEIAPSDYEARWRAARAALILGVIEEDRERTGRWLRIAVQHASEARRLRPDNVDAIAWLAAAKGRLAQDIGGAREQVRLAQEVWALTQEALAIDGNHALANSVFGKLNQEVRSLSGFERFIARTFMGGGDPMKSSSWEAAEEHILRALENEPGTVLFYKDLGDTYRIQDKLDLARTAYQEGLAAPDLYPSDPMWKEQMADRIKQLGR
jgi:tetratricopeptide (TPR) repeat protein